MKSFSQIKGRSAEYARNRIKLLLVSERIDCSPQMISMLKNDLIHTVKKYISIDEKQVTVQITQEPPVIHAKIPVCSKKGTKDKMLKQYKLRFYNFRLVIFLLGDQCDRNRSCGKCEGRSEIQTACGCDSWSDHYGYSVIDGLFLDFKFPVDHVWRKYCAFADRTTFW